ncbi:hypothetical protein RJ639_042029 [Escallonia herrerae]|uniref:Uncharacterized protein n=1 Tax=Escallonia herrerae TaxID=1293975 RepID=A0AA88WF32_9ASTE|nr:hypothetical protein RJ639_042029 [Escallonia herrerae]
MVRALLVLLRRSLGGAVVAASVGRRRLGTNDASVCDGAPLDRRGAGESLCRLRRHSSFCVPFFCEIAPTMRPTVLAVVATPLLATRGISTVTTGGGGAVGTLTHGCNGALDSCAIGMGLGLRAAYGRRDIVPKLAYRAKGSMNEDQTQIRHQDQGIKEELEMELYPTGSSLPDCSHACGPCFPCERVMV